MHFDYRDMVYSLNLQNLVSCGHIQINHLNIFIYFFNSLFFTLLANIQTYRLYTEMCKNVIEYVYCKHI